jgi:Tfp pilus assembly protein PilF
MIFPARVSKALAVKLGTGVGAGQPLVDVATDNPHAHDLYLRAKQLSYRSDEASLNQAVVLFNQATVEDPNYAAAWAGLAYTYAFLADAYRAPDDLLPAMQGAAQKAVALDPDLAEGDAYLGYVLLTYQREYPAAMHELERAVTLNQGSADAHFFLGLGRLIGKDPASARVEIQVCEKIDPLNPWCPYTEVWAITAQGDYPSALQQAQRVLQLDPGFYYLADPLLYVYASFGLWQDCIDRAAMVHAVAGREPDYKAAVCHAHSGNPERARSMLAQLEAAARTHYVDHVGIAEIHMALGDKDGAFAALDQAYRDRSQPLLNLWFLPEFKPLHDDPRYRALSDGIYAGLKPGVTP